LRLAYEINKLFINKIFHVTIGQVFECYVDTYSDKFNLYFYILKSTSLKIFFIEAQLFSMYISYCNNEEVVQLLPPNNRIDSK